MLGVILTKVKYSLLGINSHNNNAVNVNDSTLDLEGYQLNRACRNF